MCEGWGRQFSVERTVSQPNAQQQVEGFLPCIFQSSRRANLTCLLTSMTPTTMPTVAFWNSLSLLLMVLHCLACWPRWTNNKHNCQPTSELCGWDNRKNCWVEDTFRVEHVVRGSQTNVQTNQKIFGALFALRPAPARVRGSVTVTMA